MFWSSKMHNISQMATDFDEQIFGKRQGNSVT